MRGPFRKTRVFSRPLLGLFLCSPSKLLRVCLSTRECFRFDLLRKTHFFRRCFVLSFVYSKPSIYGFEPLSTCDRRSVAYLYEFVVVARVFRSATECWPVVISSFFSFSFCVFFLVPDCILSTKNKNHVYRGCTSVVQIKTKMPCFCSSHAPFIFYTRRRSSQ